MHMKNEKIAILLLHAYMGSENDIQNLKNFLNKNEFNTFSMTFKGHNEKSIKNILKVNPNEWYLQAKEKVLNLKNLGYEKIIVMGLSLGGIISIKLTEEMDIYATGTFCSPVIPLENDLTHLIPSILQYEKYNIKKYNINVDDVDKYLNSFLDDINLQLKKLEIFTEEIENNLDYIKIPVYIAQGKNDELFNYECSNLLYKKIKNQTFTKYHLFENSGHVITIGKDKDKFNESVLNFIKSII